MNNYEIKNTGVFVEFQTNIFISVLYVEYSDNKKKRKKRKA